MRKIRLHLRHTGDENLRFGVQRRRDGFYNVYLGRLFLAVRDCTNPYLKPEDYKFFDLGFGREQLKFERLFMTMSDAQKSSYWEARHPDNWYKHTPMYLKAFIEHYESSTCCHYFKEN